MKIINTTSWNYFLALDRLSRMHGAGDTHVYVEAMWFMKIGKLLTYYEERTTNVCFFTNIPLYTNFDSVSGKCRQDLKVGGLKKTLQKKVLWPWYVSFKLIRFFQTLARLYHWCFPPHARIVSDILRGHPRLHGLQEAHKWSNRIVTKCQPRINAILFWYSTLLQFKISGKHSNNFLLAGKRTDWYRMIYSKTLHSTSA